MVAPEPRLARRCSLAPTPMIRFLLAITLFLLGALPASAQVPRENAIQPELVLRSHATPGSGTDLAILMHTSPGWHGYWLNPGDAGLPMEVEWTLPPGWKVEPLRYPVPHKLLVAGIVNYVFESDYAVLTRIVPPTAPTASRISAKLRWLACTDKICVPEQGEVSIDVPTSGMAIPDARFDNWLRALPRPLGSKAHFALRPKTIDLAIPLPASVAVERRLFLPGRRRPDRLCRAASSSDEPATRWSSNSADATAIRPRSTAFFRSVGGAAWKSLRRPARCLRAADSAPNALVVGAARRACRRDHPQPDAVRLPDPRPEGDAPGARGWRRAARPPRRTRLYAWRDPWHRRARHPASCDPRQRGSGGLGLPASGPAFDPDPVAARGGDHAQPAAGVRTADHRRRNQPGGSIGTGALAAFVATPCAGPFMGAALGTALVLPTWGAVLVFAALGLGLALPFLAIAFIPALRTRLPKPGPWMARLAAHSCRPDGADRGGLPLAVVATGWSRLRCRIGLGAIALARAVAVVRRSRPARRASLSAGCAWRCAPRLRSPVSLLVPTNSQKAAPSDPGMVPCRRGNARRNRASRCSFISPPTGA